MFYVAAALFAPLREIYLLTRGRSSLKRWSLIGRQFLLASCVVVAIIVFYWCIDLVISNGWMLDRRNRLPWGMPAWIFAFVALAALLVGLGIWSWGANRHWREYRAHVIARAHRLGVSDKVGIIAGVADSEPMTPRGRHLRAAARVIGRTTSSIRDVDLAWLSEESELRSTSGDGRHLQLEGRHASFRRVKRHHD